MVYADPPGAATKKDHLAEIEQRLSGLESAFSFHARSDIRWLLDEVERLRRSRKKDRETLATVLKWANWVGDGRSRHVRSTLRAIINNARRGN
jgi:glycerol kinase